MNRPRICALVGLVVLTAAGCGGGGQASPGGASSPGRQLVVGQVLAGPRNDQGFYQVLYGGLQRAARDYGVKPLVLDLVAHANAPDAMRNLVSQSADLVIALNEQEDALAQVAKEFPSTKFLNYDGAVRSANIGDYGINESQGAYFLGASAGLLGHKVVGWTTSVEIPQFVSDLKAFRAGIASVNPDAKVLTAVTGDFNDPVKAKEAVLAQVRQGATLVLGVWGGNVAGLVQALAESPGVKGVSNSVDRCGQAPNWQLLWQLNGGEVVYLAVGDFVKGAFKLNQSKVIGLENPKVSDTVICGGTPPAIQSTLATIKQDLVSGKIQVSQPGA